MLLIDTQPTTCFLRGFARKSFPICRWQTGERHIIEPFHILARSWVGVGGSQQEWPPPPLDNKVSGGWGTFSPTSPSQDDLPHSRLMDVLLALENSPCCCCCVGSSTQKACATSPHATHPRPTGIPPASGSRKSWMSWSSTPQRTDRSVPCWTAVVISTQPAAIPAICGVEWVIYYRPGNSGWLPVGSALQGQEGGEFSALPKP